jgi:hypothetical protein
MGVAVKSRAGFFPRAEIGSRTAIAGVGASRAVARMLRASGAPYESFRYPRLEVPPGRSRHVAGERGSVWTRLLETTRADRAVARLMGFLAGTLSGGWHSRWRETSRLVEIGSVTLDLTELTRAGDVALTPAERVVLDAVEDCEKAFWRAPILELVTAIETLTDLAEEMAAVVQERTGIAGLATAPPFTLRSRLSGTAVAVEAFRVEVYLGDELVASFATRRDPATNTDELVETFMHLDAPPALVDRCRGDAYDAWLEVDGFGAQPDLGDTHVVEFRYPMPG